MKAKRSNNHNGPKTSSDTVAELDAEIERLQKIRDELAEAEEKAKKVLARGTQDLTELARQVVSIRDMTEEEVQRAIERELRAAPRTYRELAEILGVRMDRVKEVNKLSAGLAWVKRHNKVVNRGTRGRGVWQIKA